ncbi:MAG TPA: tetratricopeptide repeat protein [Anaerolineae bacterium]|nr:tetratricopeptide repeat protein [Anaerolineae bacterium]
MVHEHILVGREPELARLEELLSAAVTGRGQVCLVSGEAGVGKTTLLTEFGRRAEARYPDVVTAVGTCDAQTGVGDAYLPFREVLDLLTGDVDARLAQGRVSPENARRLRDLLILSGQVLMELGPDLVGLFVPGATLLARLGEALVEKSRVAERLKERPLRGQGPGAQALEQAQIFEQYVNVMRALAAKRPLVLVIEDLQWADVASIGLLFRLTRRLEGSRLFLLGTYRPSDVALGRDGERHPLEPVLAEIKRYHGDVWIDLDRARAERGRQFVDAFLDTHFRCLDAAIRDTLFEHTGGHPLFTVELVRHLIERDYLLPDAERCWHASPELDWEDLPARVEGVIEERIGRLAEDLRRSLTVASVEGEQFTAEVVARVRSLEVRELVASLSDELQKEHRLVESGGVRRLAAGRASYYRFSHNLVQTYLYSHLDPVQLSYLHEDVGNALELLYAGQTDDIAVQLARHFELAGVPDKARQYFRAASEQAAARAALPEAVNYVSRALELTPEGADDERYELLRARAAALDLQGAREAQRQDLAEMRRLAEGQRNLHRLAEVALREAELAGQSGDLTAALRAVEESAALAVQAGDTLAEARAEYVWGRAYLQHDDHVPARPHVENALRLARRAGNPLDNARSLFLAAILAHSADELDEALAKIQEAVTLFQSLGAKRDEAHALYLYSQLTTLQGNHPEALRQAENGAALSHQVGWRPREADFMLMIANCHLALGDFERSRIYIEQTDALATELGEEGLARWALHSLGRLYDALNRPARALDCYRPLLQAMQSIGYRSGEAIVLGDIGYALLQNGDWTAALEAFERSVDLWRELGQHAEAVSSLAGLAWAYGALEQPEHARTYVSEVLDWIHSHHVLPLKPVRLYLVCYLVLDALAEREAADRVLEQGHARLMLEAGYIEPPAARDRFIERIAFNQAVHAAWLARQSSA